MDNLSMEKAKYEKLKTKVKYMIKYLNDCIEKLQVPALKINEYYNIDNTSIDGGNLTNVRDNYISRRNYLKNTILVEIENKIKEFIEAGIE